MLDGAILVLCGVAGVQSQSFTVDRQMRRYNVPRIAFVNKLDRAGANSERVADQLRRSCATTPVMTQSRSAPRTDFEGIIDLIRMKAFYFDGDNGEDIREEEIPADRVDEAKTARHEMIAAIADVDDQIAEKFLAEQDPSIEELRAAIRRVDHRAQDDAGVHRLGLQEQGRAAPARRREHVPAEPHRGAERALDQDKNEEKVDPRVRLRRSRSWAWRSSSRTAATAS